ncbi:hypothetical protein VB779_09415 [Haloarculaceae archaeon H-GB11]|nr:hypothetical protein [Haloarculaceae archaeon H-GB11]
MPGTNGERPSVSADEVFLDTSVFLNWIQREVEGNKGSVEIFGDSSLDKTIGTVAKDELHERCNVRKKVYRDVSVFINKSPRDDDDFVYEYEPRKCNSGYDDLELTDNDVTHIHQLQHYIAEECDKPAYTLRRYARFFEDRLDDLLKKSENFPNEPDSDLAENIDNEIDNWKDGQVLAQAVKWKRVRVNNDGKDVDAVVSDDGDMHQNEDEINDAIESTRNHSEWSSLTIYPLTDFKQGDD